MDTLCDQMMLKGFLMKIPDWITKYTNTLNELHQTGCKVVELGAGSGFLAACIMANSNKPINYLATDAMKGDDTFTKTYFKVQKLNHIEALTKNPDADVLIINWPTYQNKWASEALRKFEGDIVIYIGEGMGGCNADDVFF